MARNPKETLGIPSLPASRAAKVLRNLNNIGRHPGVIIGGGILEIYQTGAWVTEHTVDHFEKNHQGPCTFEATVSAVDAGMHHVLETVDVVKELIQVNGGRVVGENVIEDQSKYFITAYFS